MRPRKQCIAIAFSSRIILVTANLPGRAGITRIRLPIPESGVHRDCGWLSSGLRCPHSSQAFLISSHAFKIPPHGLNAPCGVLRRCIEIGSATIIIMACHLVLARKSKMHATAEHLQRIQMVRIRSDLDQTPAPSVCPEDLHSAHGHCFGLPHRDYAVALYPHPTRWLRAFVRSYNRVERLCMPYSIVRTPVEDD